MAEYSAGKKLSTARLARGLSIDEAAHATKMRPDKILALENDDFTRFGSPAYAKGFLLMYSRFLRADVSEQLREFDAVDTRVNVSDYQYLSNVDVPAPDKGNDRIPMRALERRRQPSIVPLLVFVVLLLMAGVGYYIFINYQRLEPTKSSVQTATPAPIEATPTPAPKAEPPAPNAVAQVAPPRGPDPKIEEPPPKSELVVQPVKKAWVRIRLDSKESKPVFEGDLYPWAPPLKVKASRFFVEVRDQASVEIRNDGRLIAYQAPGITVP
jgi:cytoskeleton protein RodZ